MGAPADSQPSIEPVLRAPAAPAGLDPGERNVVAGRYRLLSFIAEGGMGAVYVAEHVLSKKRLALKVVHPYLCKGTQGVERFRREVSAAADIDHPGIVQVYDAGVDDDEGFFMAMELLEGESLGDLLRRDWPGMATSIEYIEQMLEPLAKAHDKGFIHRDLKPDNVFLAKQEEGPPRLKLLDFGLAREVDKAGATRTGITFGTPEYMSPEQAISARQVRAPGDVWSVGVMLYELLAGVHPFTGETPNLVMANAIKDPLPPLRSMAPHVPEPLATFIERCLEKEPADRPQTAGEMLVELRAVSASVTLDETVPELTEPPLKAGSEEPEPAISSLNLVVARPCEAALSARLLAPASEPDDELPTSNRLRWVVAGGVALLGATVLGGVLFYGASSGPGETQMVVTSLEPRAGEATAPETGEPEPASASEAATAPAVAVEPETNAEPEAEAEAEAEAGVEAAAASQAEPTPAEPPAAANSGARRRPRVLEQARELLANGEEAEARSLLTRQGRSPAELAMLIELLRSQGRSDEAARVMRNFIRRWPTRGPSDEYRSWLQSRYGG